MKKTFFLAFGVLAMATFSSCGDGDNNNDVVDTLDMTTTTTTTTTYTDLATGQPVELRFDEDATGTNVRRHAVNAQTGEPVRFYIDNSRPTDTIYGVTGSVANNVITVDPAGVYMIDESKVKWDGEDFKILGEDGSKIKVDGDEMKIKEADGSKYKVDGDESKYKSDDVKIKNDGNETKIKTPDGKVKIEDGEVKVK